MLCSFGQGFYSVRWKSLKFITAFFVLPCQNERDHDYENYDLISLRPIYNNQPMTFTRTWPTSFFFTFRLGHLYTSFVANICIITKSMHALWLVSQLWVIVPVNPAKISRVFWIIIKAIDHKFLWVIGWQTTWNVGRALEEFVNHSPAARVLQFFECATNIPRSLSAYNPQKLVVYCLSKPLKFSTVLV